MRGVSPRAALIRDSPRPAQIDSAGWPKICEAAVAPGHAHWAAGDVCLKRLVNSRRRSVVSADRRFGRRAARRSTGSRTAQPEPAVEARRVGMNSHVHAGTGRARLAAACSCSETMRSLPAVCIDVPQVAARSCGGPVDRRGPSESGDDESVCVREKRLLLFFVSGAAGRVHIPRRRYHKII